MKRFGEEVKERRQRDSEKGHSRFILLSFALQTFFFTILPALFLALFISRFLFHFLTAPEKSASRRKGRVIKEKRMRDMKESARSARKRSKREKDM